MAGLESIPFTLPPSNVSTSGQILHEPHLERGISPPAPTSFKGKIVQQRGRPELACIGKIVGQLVIAGQLKGRPIRQGMSAANLKVMGTLSPRKVVGSI